MTQKKSRSSMAESQKIADLLKGAPRQNACINGWVRTRRDSKGGFSFIEVNDGSCMANIQVVADDKLANYTDTVKKLYVGCSIQVRGEVVESQGGKQGLEMVASDITMFGGADPDQYLLGKQRVNFEVLREYPHLRSRTNTFGAVARVRNALSFSVHEFFQKQGFLYVHTPIITSSDCEGAGEMFQVTTLDLEKSGKGGQPVPWQRDFFKQQAFLTVSGQLEVETYCCSLGDVYTFGPTFRAENSHTSRHLSEFWMIEPEMAFADLEKDMELAEAFLKHCIKHVLDNCVEDMAFFNQRIEKGILETLEKIVSSEFHHLTYTEAVKILEDCGEEFEYPVHWGTDLQSEHERYLTEKHVGGPVIVTDYPKDIKAFYMKLNEDGKTVRAMDVLLPKVGEIIGGAQREDRLDVLDSRMRDSGIDPEEMEWYRDLRKFGSIPHAGFGLGFERLVQFVTGMANIRDVIPFPRTPGNLS